MKRIINFKTSDGEILHIRHWKPSKVREVIIALHGLGDHGGWYCGFLEEFYKLGYEVYAMDRRGSGLNTSNRGDITSFEVFTRDVKELIEKERLGKISFIGVSFGALIALSYAIKYPEHVKDLMLFAPAIKSKIKLSIFYELSVLHAMVFNPTRMFEVPYPNKWIAANKKFVDKIGKDKLHQRHFTARFYREMIRMSMFVKKNYTRLHAPQLIFLGEDDHLVENRFVFRFFTNSKIIVYKGAAHGMFVNNVRQISEDIHGWLKQVGKERGV